MTRLFHRKCRTHEILINTCSTWIHVLKWMYCLGQSWLCKMVLSISSIAHSCCWDSLMECVGNCKQGPWVMQMQNCRKISTRLQSLMWVSQAFFSKDTLLRDICKKHWRNIIRKEALYWRMVPMLHSAPLITLSYVFNEITFQWRYRLIFFGL